ncbi:MAG: sensor histidine kinase, partial [Actinomycetaceae bacterium]
QLPFVATAAVVARVHIATRTEALHEAPTVAALLVVVAATTAAVAMPWHLLPRWAVAVVPVADVVAIVLLISDSLVISSMLVLPVLWLARAFPHRGYAGAIALGVLAAWSNDLWPLLTDGTVADAGPATLQLLVIVPAVLASVAIVVSASERRASARLQLMAAQSRLVEESLDESRTQRRLLEAVLNTVDVGVVALDPVGRVSLINRLLREDGAPIPAVGESVTDVQVLERFDGRVLGDDGATALAPHERPMLRAHRGERIVRELVWWTGEGADAPSAQRVSAAQLTDEEGNRAGAVLVYQDLTKEMAALAQRDDFVSSVTHELRTPLTSVLGYLDLALDTPDLPADATARLEIAVRNAERLELLISNLLVAARESAGASPAPVGRVDLSDVVRDVAEGQAPRAADGKVAVSVIADEACDVEADRTRLTQIVDNVVSNAIKYSRPGDSVTVETWRGVDTVHLQVVDTGIGISAGDQVRLFTRFYRAPSVRQGKVQGTGLGLHITKQLVEALGGEITLESAPGVGTTVDVTLPAAGAR